MAQGHTASTCLVPLRISSSTARATCTQCAALSPVRVRVVAALGSRVDIYIDS